MLQKGTRHRRGYAQGFSAVCVSVYYIHAFKRPHLQRVWESTEVSDLGLQFFKALLKSITSFPESYRCLRRSSGVFRRSSFSLQRENDL